MTERGLLTAARRACVGRFLRVSGPLACLVIFWVSTHVAGAQQSPGRPGEPPARVITVADGYGRGARFSVPDGIWLDARRAEIYVADRGNHKIAVFDKDGQLLRSFIHWVPRTGPRGKVVPQPGEPSSVAVNSRGDIFVVDGFDNAVDVLDYRGRSMQRIPVGGPTTDGKEGKSSDQPVPVEVAVDEQDHVYVATSGGHCQIIVLDENYQVIRRIGRRGRERGAFYAVTGLSVDKQGRVLVTDAQSVPVQVFSPEGELLLAFGAHEVGWENFSLPSGVVRDGDGDLWVVDSIRQVVKRFDESGHFLGVIGGLGSAPGDMYYPTALAGDGGRMIVVLERNGARFQVFQVTS